MKFEAESIIAAEMGKFLMNGSLYRGAKPVMWSPVEKTALAEAEVEYSDHKSVTIFARFTLKQSPVAGGWKVRILSSGQPPPDDAG